MSANTAIQLATQPAAISNQVFDPQNMGDLMKLCQYISKSSLVPDELRGRPDNIMIVAMKGREFGWSFMRSMSHIHVIKGKSTISAEGLGGLVQQRPDICRYFRLVETDEVHATYETHRLGQDKPIRMSYTLEQAKKAGLTDKDNWKRMPAEMLRARAASSLARAVYPDITMGLYSTEEMRDVVDIGKSRVEHDDDGAFSSSTGEVVDLPSDDPLAPETDEQKVARWTERFKGCTTKKELAQASFDLKKEGADNIRASLVAVFKEAEARCSA